MTSSISKIRTVVILAAGMGIRLRNVTGLLPKGLLEVGGKSLISRSLGSLKNEGIDIDWTYLPTRVNKLTVVE